MRRDAHPAVDVAVLDTNVFLKDAYALFSIDVPLIVVPFHVLEELDDCKEVPGVVGRNARQAIHVIEALRLKGDLHRGVQVNEDTSSARVQVTPLNFFNGHNLTTDEAVIATAEHFNKQGKATLLCTQDINMRMKASQHGIISREYRAVPLALPHELAHVHTQAVPAKDLKSVTQSKVAELLSTDLTCINQFVRLHSENNPENYRLFRFLGGNEFHEVHPQKLFGVFSALNKEQAMALDLLLDDSIKLVSLIGKAGTGKTFLVLLAGLYKMLHERAYKRVMVTRPTVSLGPEIGFLPGDADEKLEIWMHPVFDNISMIAAGIKQKKVPFHINLEDLKKQDQICLQAITYMRGRSLPYQFLFVDEAQNLTPLELKTLITRAGVGTKVIISGDPDQIDTKHLNHDNNGLMVTTRKFTGDPLFGVVHLQHSERSELAQRAAELL